MNRQHQHLASGRWAELSLAEQLGNIGSEYDRAVKWHMQKDTRFQSAFDRYLELLDMAVADSRLNQARKRELLRLRETSCAEFTGTMHGDAAFSKYFYYFAVLARRGR